MNKEINEFFKSIFINNKLTLDQPIPDQIYKELVYPVRHLIKTKKYIPINDLLDLDSVPWESISQHPEITLNIIKDNFHKLNFENLVENPKVDLEQLHLIIKQNPFNDSKVSLGRKTKTIFESSGITPNLVLKFANSTTKLELETFTFLDFTGISEQNKIKILKMYHGDDSSYILTLIEAALPHHIFYRLLQNWFKSQIFLKSHYAYSSGYFVRSYVEIYQSSPSFIKDMILFYKLCKQFNHDRSFGAKLGEILVQNSTTQISDLKQLIQEGIITVFPNKVKHRHIASFFYQELLKRNITVDLTTLGKQAFQLTLVERNYIMDILFLKSSFPVFELCSPSQIKYLMHSYIRRNHSGSIIGIFLNKYHDYPQIINDFYHNLKKNMLYRDFISAGNPIGQSSEVFLVLCLPDYVNSPFNIRWSNTIFTKQKLSPACLNDVLSIEPFPTSAFQAFQHIINIISTYQPLTPELINKYSSILNWDLLKFNEVWTKYPHDLFNKLPIFDQDNFWLWASTEEKMEQIRSFGFPESEIYQWEKDSDWIIVPHAIKYYAQDSLNFCFNFLCRYNTKCPHNICKTLTSVQRYNYHCNYEVKYSLGVNNRKRSVPMRFHLSGVVLKVIKKEMYIKTNSPGIEMSPDELN